MTLQTEASLSDRSTKNIHMLPVYTASVSGAGLVLLLIAISLVPTPFPDILLFIGLVVVAELTSSASLQPQVLFSMSSAVTFAALLLFGPLAACIVAMVGGLIITLVTDISSTRQKQPFLQRALFNMAARGLAITIAGIIYVILGGMVGRVAHVSNIIPLVLAAILAEFSNANLVIGAVAIQMKRSVYQIWKENVSWAVPINILTMIIGGGGLAIGYQIAGILGIGVFLLPIALTIYAFRLYVSQTREQMSRLEEIIAERTKALQEANRELKRLDQIKTGFFSMINHEMRNPLASIMGYTELLQLDSVLPQENQYMLDSVRESCHVLLDLVNDILDISRIEDGNLNVLPEPMALPLVINDTLSTLKPSIDKKHIQVVLNVPDELPSVYADPKRVYQILLNLLSNAVKYTPDDGQIHIVAQCNASDQFVALSVIDTGIGIPQEHLPYIFDRFSRVERPEINHIVGTGLGLSITKGLVEAQGGELTVNSEEGRGTCFTFTLPLSEVTTLPQDPSVSLALES